MYVLNGWPTFGSPKRLKWFILLYSSATGNLLKINYIDAAKIGRKYKAFFKHYLRSQAKKGNMQRNHAKLDRTRKYFLIAIIKVLFLEGRLSSFFSQYNDVNLRNCRTFNNYYDPVTTKIHVPIFSSQSCSKATSVELLH